MADIEESETNIIINQADLKDGYFVFGTSMSSHFQKLCRRVGETNLLEVKKSTRDGQTTYWQCKVPSRYLSKSHFGIRILGAQPRKLSQKQKSNLAYGRTKNKHGGQEKT